MKIKRKIDAILSQSTGRQLLWLFIITIVLLLIFFAIAYLFFDGFLWQDIVALFLDPGCFGGKGNHDAFRLIVSLVGCFTFSALLISVFSNIIDNISESWHQGRVRYSHKNHIIILGSATHSINILKHCSLFPDVDIVVMTSADVELYRHLLERTELPADVRRRIVLYNGERDNMDNLKSIHPELSSRIFIVGENDEVDHDNINLRACNLLQSICSNLSSDVFVTVVMDDYSTMEVIARTNSVKNSFLHIDFVNIGEYQAEKLIVNTDFMPILTEECNDSAHFVIFGNSEMARIVSLTIAHNAHYPNFTNYGKRTRLDFISSDIEPMMRDFVSTYESLFTLCNWYFYNDGIVEAHKPSPEMGDYLDIEWHFYNYSVYSETIKTHYNEICNDNHGATRIIVCEENDKMSLDTTLHLPQLLRCIPIAVYQQNSCDILSQAVTTGLYGDITIFGYANETDSDPLFLHRIERGVKVNYFYANRYNSTPPKYELDAWYQISEAHKFSSIYAGNASVLRNKTTDDNTSDYILCEMEHRRWSVSCLILGYRALSLADSAQAREDKDKFKELKRSYIHPDITPFDNLSEEEQSKDKLIISAMK